MQTVEGYNMQSSWRLQYANQLKATICKAIEGYNMQTAKPSPALLMWSDHSIFTISNQWRNTHSHDLHPKRSHPRTHSLLWSSSVPREDVQQFTAMGEMRDHMTMIYETITSCVGLAKTVNIRYFWQGIYHIYGHIHIRFWPTLIMCTPPPTCAVKQWHYRKQQRKNAGSVNTTKLKCFRTRHCFVLCTSQ